MKTYTDSHYRYPGSRPFYDNEIDRRLFFGRNKEIQLLLHKTLTSRLVVLYSKSGLGKTSLINAGLNQALRDRGFIPFKIRFNDPEIEPLKAVYTGIKDIVEQKRLDYEAGEEDSLWQFFKTAAFWGPGNTLLKPVLILDQFEEFFALHPPETRKTFIWHLADLVNNTVPLEVSAAIPKGEPLPYSDKPPNVKIIISIREDCLGQLEEMYENIPAILHHRVRLMPLSRKQAKQAIVQPSQVQDEAIGAASFKFSTEAVDMMLDFLCKRKERDSEKMTDEVEAFQLQLLCCHMEDKVHQKQEKGEGEVMVEKDDLAGETGMQRVLQWFYDDQVKQLGTVLKKRRTRRLCEKGLISVENRRLSLEEREIKRKYRIPENLLAELVNRRLLRSEPRVGSIYYELSHDTLVAPIRESQRKHQSKNRVTVLSIIGIVILLVMGYLFEKEQRIGRVNRINKLSAHALKLEKRGDYKDAVKIYKDILKLDENNASTYSKLGDAHYKQGGYYNIIKEEEKADQEYKIASEAYKKAIKIDPGYILPKMNLAVIYLINQNFNEVDKLANSVLKDKNSSTESILAMRLISISSFLLQGKYQQVYTQFTSFIGFYKTLPGDYDRIGDFSITKKFINSHKKLSSTEKWLLLQIVELLESPLEQGRRKLQESGDLNNIAHLYSALGIYNDAVEYLEKDIKSNPGKTSSKINLAAMYLIKKDFEGAEKLAKEVLEEKMRIENRLMMKSVSIASLLFLGEQKKAFIQFEDFKKYYKSLPGEYKRSWNYQFSEGLIRRSKILTPFQIELLLLFMDLIKSPLEEGQEKLKNLESYILSPFRAPG